MALRIGDINRLKVNRKTDIGYLLDSSEGEVFLHQNETNHANLKPEDVVDVFLYYDHKGRLAATLNPPLITMGRPTFLEVVDVNEKLGVFMNIGITKGLLLSKDDLPLNPALWPRPGDKVYCYLKLKGRLVAKPAEKEDVTLIPDRPLELKETVNAHVQKIGREGMNLLTGDGHFIFVHHTMYKQPYRLGQELEVKLTYRSEKGYTGSLIEQKENARIQDAEAILAYLIKKKEMPLDSDSTPEAINVIFTMSKKAFKRALGKLYKERKIEFVDGKTLLVNPLRQSE